MKRLLLLALICALAAPVHAEYLEKIFGCSARQPMCVVRNNGGGEVIDFLGAGEEIAQKEIVLKIDGECASSCSMVADLLRVARLSCVTSRAVFYFHQGYARAPSKKVGVLGKLTGERFILPHTKGIHLWNVLKGGWSTEGYREMNYPETLSFWNSCPESVPLPYPRLGSYVPFPRERPATPIAAIPAHGLY